MSDERALSLADPAGSSVRTAEYDAICDALMETSRGRWFLSEYARRARHDDTEQVLAAITRIESAIGAERERANPSIDGLRDEVAAMIAAIARLEAGLAALGPEPEPAADSWQPQELVQLVRDLGGRLDTMIELWDRANAAVAAADRPTEAAQAPPSNDQAGLPQHQEQPHTEAPPEPPHQTAEPQPIAETHQAEAATTEIVSSQARDFPFPAEPQAEAAEEDDAPAIAATRGEFSEIAPEHEAGASEEPEPRLDAGHDPVFHEAGHAGLYQPAADPSAIAAAGFEAQAEDEDPVPVEIRADAELAEQDLCEPAEPAHDEMECAPSSSSPAPDAEDQDPPEARVAEEPATIPAEAVAPSKLVAFGLEFDIPGPLAELPEPADEAGPAAACEDDIEIGIAPPAEPDAIPAAIGAPSWHAPDTPVIEIAAPSHGEPRAETRVWTGSQAFLPDIEFGVVWGNTVSAPRPAESAPTSWQAPPGAPEIDAMVLDFAPGRPVEPAWPASAFDQAFTGDFRNRDVSAPAEVPTMAAEASVGEIEYQAAVEPTDATISTLPAGREPPAPEQAESASAIPGMQSLREALTDLMVADLDDAARLDETHAPGAPACSSGETAHGRSDEPDPWPVALAVATEIAEPPPAAATDDQPSAPVPGSDEEAPVPSLRDALTDLMVSDLDQAARLGMRVADHRDDDVPGTSAIPDDEPTADPPWAHPADISEEVPPVASPASPAPEPLPVMTEAPAAVPAAGAPAPADPLAPLAALSEDETIALFT